MKPWDQAGGCTFARFMEEALWGERGYYASHVEIGFEQADFYTAASFPLFGATLANYVMQAFDSKVMDCLNIVEIGPGEGTLMVSLASRLMRQVASPTQIVLTLIEPSEALRERQRVRVETWARGLPEEDGSRVTWRWQSGFDPVGHEVIVLANEVLDALPVEWVRRTESGWLQAYVSGSSLGKLTRNWRPASTELSRACEQWLPIPVDSEAELCLEYPAFLQQVFRLGRKVRLLLMDYGIDRAEWGAGARPRGTIRSYFEHQLVDMFAHVGDADMTADVHWDLVRHAAMQLGAKVSTLESQREFLLRIGIMNVLQDMQPGGTIDGSGQPPSLQFRQLNSTARHWNNQFKQLILPGAMGDRFSALECVKE